MGHTAAAAATTANGSCLQRNKSFSVQHEKPTSTVKVKRSSTFRLPSFFGGGGASASNVANEDMNSSAPNSPVARQNFNNLRTPSSSLVTSQLMTSSLTSFNNIDDEDEYANTVVAGTGSVSNLDHGSLGGPSSLDTFRGRSFHQRNRRQ